ncbi:asparagine synthase-related protein [Paucibacter sp. O1-1]|nr:asparagine synthase-related protein [Paucibacter sp. O1-1]MDA3830156.1 asparagine synthase-related protein [Paucibacter sp. O1-1]
MFRYIAMVWAASHPQQAAAAHSLSRNWQQRADWHAALLQPGLHVFTAGSKPGINMEHLLPEGFGLILGKLFRRVEFDSTPSPCAVFSDDDAASISRSGGRALVDHFWGRYIAFLPSAPGGTAVLRDPSGTLPCFRTCHEGVTVFFSWLDDLLEMIGPAEKLRVDWEVLMSRVMHGPPNGRHTALAGICQLLPGERFDVGTGQSSLLWSAVDQARSAADMKTEDATRLLGHAVRSCVRSWAACYETLLLRLSGGVDSSILAACLSPRGTPADVICVNYHSPGSDSDERHFAMLAAGRAGRDLITRERDPGFRIERVLQIARMPNPVPYVGAMNASSDASLAAAHQAGALFAGTGGDPLFYELPSWWPAADYLHDKGLDTGFAAAAMDAARLDRVSLWRATRLAWQERFRPDLAARVQTMKNALLATELTEKPQDGLRFAHPALREALDLPIGKHVQTVALMYPIGYYEPFEQARAPESVHPLFSQPLVELCLRLPSYLLTRGGQGRALARRAFAAELPTQIVHRRSKGGIDDHVKAVLQRNLEFVRALLLDGELCRRGIIDRAKVEEALSGRPTTLPWLPGLVHELVAIEAWASRWKH